MADWKDKAGRDGFFQEDAKTAPAPASARGR